MSTYIPTRRKVLQGLVAAGCVLCLPRGIAAEAEAGKMEKSQAKYQSQPKGEQRCSGCINFMPDSNTCKLVSGDISADGWCMLWAAK